ncbi:MAG: hypothetical protein CMM87_00115 [Rickettsiales bacterium]|nr:hypothetical protein [Rickettsiales bacterium]
MKSIIKKQNNLKFVSILSVFFVVAFQINANIDTSVAFLNLDTLGNLDPSEIIDNANREIITPERKNLEETVQKKLADIAKTGGSDIPGTKDKSYKEVVKKDAGFLLEGERFKKLSDKALNALKEKEYSTEIANGDDLDSPRKSLRVVDKSHVVSEVSSLLRRKGDESVDAPDYNNTITSNPLDKTVKANPPAAVLPQDNPPPQEPQPEQPPQPEPEPEPQAERPVLNNPDVEDMTDKVKTEEQKPEKTDKITNIDDLESEPEPQAQRPVLNNPDVEDMTDKVKTEEQKPEKTDKITNIDDLESEPEPQAERPILNNPDVEDMTDNNLVGIDDNSTSAVDSFDNAFNSESLTDRLSGVALNISTETQAEILGVDSFADIDLSGVGGDTVVAQSTDNVHNINVSFDTDLNDVAFYHITQTTEGAADFVTADQVLLGSSDSSSNSSDIITIPVSSDSGSGGSSPEVV